MAIALDYVTERAIEAYDALNRARAQADKAAWVLEQARVRANELMPVLARGLDEARRVQGR